MSFTYESTIGYNSPGTTYGGAGQYNARPTPSAEFIRRIKLPNIRKVFLLTVQARIWMNGKVSALGGDVLFKFPIPTGAQVTGVFRSNGETSLKAVVPNDLNSIQQGEYFFGDGTAGSVAGTLYWGAVNGGKPWTDTYAADITFRFSNASKTFRGYYWDPRIQSVPNLSLRIEPRWSKKGAPAQQGGGRLSLANADIYFDDKDPESSIQWDAGIVTLEMGIDLVGVGAAGEMSEADYQKIGTWRIDGTERTDEVFILNLREIKTKLSNQIPHILFNRTDYPNLPNDAVGKPIPFAWGKIYGAKPVLIDATAKRFKVASHPIRSFDGLRVQLNGVWTDTNFASYDLTKAEFTIGSEWTGSEEVSVDFSGRKNPDGTLMTNAADVMADLLDYVGETNFDQTSFDESRRLLKVGTNRYGENICTLAPSIYLDTQIAAEQVASVINEVAGSSLFVDFSGNWRYVVFSPVRGATLDIADGVLPRTFSEREIINDSFRKQIDTSEVYSRVLIRYATRKQEDWSEIYEKELLRNSLLHNLPPQFTPERELAVSESRDAIYWAQRFLVTEGEPLVKYFLAVPWNGFFLLPTDKIHVTYERSNFDTVLEVLEVNYDLISGQLKLVCGNQRGFGDSFWFWSEDGVENWPAAGSGWSNSKVATIRQNQGFWSKVGIVPPDETDMADRDDYRSFYAGRWF